MPKRSNVSQIYIPEEFRSIWDKFMEICDREGSSGSKKIREFVEEHVRRHEPGNPQARLDVILDRGAPPYEPPTCSYCLKPATYIVYLHDRPDAPSRKAYACNIHRNLIHAQEKQYGERKL